MTNQQLYLAIGIPLIVNFGLIMALYLSLNKRIDDFRDAIYKYVDSKIETINVKIDNLTKEIAEIKSLIKEIRDQKLVKTN